MNYFVDKEQTNKHFATVSQVVTFSYINTNVINFKKTLHGIENYKQANCK